MTGQIFVGPLLAIAQIAATPIVDPPTASGVAATPIIVAIAIDRELSSHDAKIDDMFPIKLDEPLVIDNRLVLPAGLTGEGQVVHASRAKGLGKGGELIVAARYLQCGTSRIALRGFRLDGAGDDRTGTLVAATAVAGLIATPLMFMKGGESIIPVRTVGHAKLAGPLPVAADGAPPCGTAALVLTPPATNVLQQGVTK